MAYKKKKATWQFVKIHLKLNRELSNKGQERKLVLTVLKQKLRGLSESYYMNKIDR